MCQSRCVAGRLEFEAKCRGEKKAGAVLEDARQERADQLGHQFDVRRLATRTQGDRWHIRVALRRRVCGRKSLDNVEVRRLAFTARDDPVDVGQNETQTASWQLFTQVDPRSGRGV